MLRIRGVVKGQVWVWQFVGASSSNTVETSGWRVFSVKVVHFHVFYLDRLLLAIVNHQAVRLILPNLLNEQPVLADLDNSYSHQNR